MGVAAGCSIPKGERAKIRGGVLDSLPFTIKSGGDAGAHGKEASGVFASIEEANGGSLVPHRHSATMKMPQNHRIRPETTRLAIS